MIIINSHIESYKVLKMQLYKQSGEWEEVDDFISKLGDMEWGESLRLSGYNCAPSVSIASTDASQLSIDVYSESFSPNINPPYEFLVVIELGISGGSILVVQSLQDLMHFLKENAPTVTAVDTWRMVHEKHEQTHEYIG